MIIAAIMSYFITALLALDCYKEAIQHKKTKDEFYISMWYFIFLLCFIVLNFAALVLIFYNLF